MKQETLTEYFLIKGLTLREIEIAHLVIRGFSNKEVSISLSIADKTVRFHLTSIYKKLDVEHRGQLIVKCLPRLTMQELESLKGA